MKKHLLFLLILTLFAGSTFAAKDSLEIKPNRDGLCCWTLTVKNRNNQSKAIDEIRFQITTSDGTVFEDLKNVAQWTENIFDVTASYVAEVNPIAAGATKSDFGICLGVSKTDQPINVKWVTYNSLAPIDSGTLQFICSPTQSYRNDSVSVVPSVVNNDPHFNFTLYNKNEFAIPIARFAAQLVTPAAGTMRPSKITPPSGWKLDSVTGTTAYFSSNSPSDYLNYDEQKSDYKITLRGNPSVKQFSFAWFTYDDGGALISRDTIRNIPANFTGFASDADTVKMAVLNGCLYEMTVKNYHVSNQTPISRIRRIAVWRRDAAVTFINAPNAPAFWTKTVKSDSIIFTAPHDSLSIPGGVVNSLFRFTVDAPSTSFTIGWKTFKSLSYADSLSSGSQLLQCQKEAPKRDTATISDASLCSYLITYHNEHNQPPSNLVAVKLSIPAGKGKLSASFSSLGWTKQNETDLGVTFVVGATGTPQSTGMTQDILFSIEPTTPGEQFQVRWETFDEGALTTGTPLFTGQHTVGCTPVVSLCDEVTTTSLSGQQCSYDYSFKNLRDTVMNRLVFEVGKGWTVFIAEAPANWNVQLLNNKTIAQITAQDVFGIKEDSTLGGFVIQYFKEDSVARLDTFNVTVKRYDATEKECVDVIQHICQTTPKVFVAQKDIIPSSITVHPNPTSSDATITLSMEGQARVTITVLDVLGREVKMVGSSILSEGEHQVRFSMQGMEEGTYYIRVQTATGVVTKKIVYIP